MVVYYLFNKTRNVIQAWFNKNRLKFLKYPFLTGFLSSIYDINVRDPKLKKNYIEEDFELGMELWLGYMMHDAPILLIIALLIYPKAFAKYMLSEFWVDLFFAQAYNVGQIFYVFNLSLLFPAFGCWISKYTKTFSFMPLLYIIEFFLILVSELKVINLSARFNLIFLKMKLKRNKIKNWKHF